MNKRLSFLLIFLAAAQLSFSQYQAMVSIPGSSGISINTHNGNMHYQRTDVVVPCVGLNLDMTFSYNVECSKIDSGYGNGWTHTYNRYYEKDISTNDIKLWDHKGKSYQYTFNGTAYESPTEVKDTLVEYSTGKYRLINPRGYVFYFDDSSHQKLTKIEDLNYNMPFGSPGVVSNTISIAYTNGKPTKILNDNSNKSLTLSYSNGHLATLTENNTGTARSWHYLYSNARMVRMQDPMGYWINYKYNGLMKIITIKDKNRNTFKLNYNEIGNTTGSVSKVITPLAEFHVEYDFNLRKTTIAEVVDGIMQTSSYVYDANGRITDKMGNCCGYDIEYTYDADGNMIQWKDANDYAYDYEYDNQGNVVKMTDPQGKFITYEYFAFSYDQNNGISPTLMKSMTDKNGNVTSYEYAKPFGTPLPSLYKAYKPHGVVEQYDYNVNGTLQQRLDANGNSTKYYYASTGYLETVESPVDTTEYVYDAVGRKISYTDGEGNVYNYTYDSLNRVTKVTNPLLQSKTYAYDGNSNIVSETDYFGITTSRTFDAHNRMLTKAILGDTTKYTYDEKNLRIVTDPKGNVTSYEYNSMNLLERSIDAMGNYEEAIYDFNGNVLTSTDKNLNQFTMTYDSLNRLRTKTDPLSNVVTRNYDNNGNLLSVVDASGTTAMEYDSLNRKVKVTNALNDFTEYEYDLNSNRTAYIDELQQRTEYQYDAGDRNTSIVFPNTDSTTFTFSQNGKRKSHTDEEGKLTQFTYDAVGRTLSVTNAEGELTSVVYDDVNNTATTTLPNGNAVVKAYDGHGRLLTVNDNLGPLVNYAYDANGNRTGTTDALGKTSIMQYDSLNRASWAEDREGEKTYYAYDNNGNLLRRTDRNSNLSKYEYDPLNRRVKGITALNDTIKYVYDNRNNLESLVDESGNMTTYEYDALGQKTKMIYADASNVQYFYTKTGRADYIIAAGGETIDLSYDTRSRVTAITYPNETNTYSYYNNGWLKTANNSVCELSYEYDNIGRQTKENSQLLLTGTPLHEVNSSYDLQNSTKSITYPSGQVYNYEFDVRNRLTEAREGADVLVSKSYGLSNLVLSTDYKYQGNIIASTSYTFSDNAWLTSMNHSYNGGNMGYNYTLDSLGNRRQEELVNQANYSKAYAYDARSQVTKESTGPLTNPAGPSRGPCLIINI